MAPATLRKQNKKRTTKKKYFSIDQLLANDNFFRKAFALQAQGELEEAAKYYILSIQKKPTPTAHTYLGRILHIMGATDAAIIECKQALKLDPEYSEAWNDLGIYCVEKQQLDEAEIYFKNAIKAKHYENKAFCYYNLAKFYMQKSMLIKAKSYLKKAIQEDPSLVEAKDTLNLIEKNLQ
jgi:tetratricopeptide (TPR) repeat protein